VRINDTLTLALTGEVSLDDFEQAVRALKMLLNAIRQENPAYEDVRWVVADLRASSAICQWRGIGDGAESMVREYQSIGKSVASGRMPSSVPIRLAIEQMTGVIGRSVQSVRFETRDDDAEIFSANPKAPHGGESPFGPAKFFGSVRGRIESISRHKSLQFTIYDMHTDKAISCYLEPGNEDVMRKAWGKIATVAGMVRRNPRTGEPTTVRHISADDIHLVPESTGGWRKAIGASKSRKGEIASEAAIRRGRDG
jgi:hypothetical protein